MREPITSTRYMTINVPVNIMRQNGGTNARATPGKQTSPPPRSQGLKLAQMDEITAGLATDGAVPTEV